MPLSNDKERHCSCYRALEVNVAVDHFLGGRSSSGLSLGIGLRQANGL